MVVYTCEQRGQNRLKPLNPATPFLVISLSGAPLSDETEAVSREQMGEIKENVPLPKTKPSTEQVLQQRLLWTLT